MHSMSCLYPSIRSLSLILSLSLTHTVGMRARVVSERPPSSHNGLVTAAHQDHPHHQDHRPRSTESIIIIIISIISALLLVVGLLVFLLLRKMKSSRTSVHGTSTNGTTESSKLDKSTNVNNGDVGRLNYSPDMRNCLQRGNVCGVPPVKRRGQVFTYKELEVATDMFSEENAIENGGFGLVYRGTLSDGTVAAIKVLNRGGKQGDREFRMEVDLLSRLECPYLVELLGYCADQHHRVLVFEYMPNGNLQHRLHPSTSPKQYRPLDWGARLRIALDCARALEFLHERAVPTVIYRDFKPCNVLLDHSYRAKVSNFGLAKTGSNKINNQITTRVLGTTGYVAPEYALTGKLTTKSDVYSFGVVLLELLTGRVPIDANRPQGEHVLVSWAHPRLTNREKVTGMVDPALQGQYSKKELIQIAAIAAVCVQAEPDYRPLMTDVVQSLIPLVKFHALSCPTIPSILHHHRISPRS